MRLSLEAILLIAAIVVFIVAAISSGNQFDLVAIGLALMAAGQLVGHLGLRGLSRKRLGI